MFVLPLSLFVNLFAWAMAWKTRNPDEPIAASAA
jgi:hypothetical protein